MLENCELIFECFAPGYKFMKPIRKDKRKPGGPTQTLSWTPLPKKEIQSTALRRKGGGYVYDNKGNIIITHHIDNSVEKWKQMVALAIANKLRGMSPEPAIPFGGELVLVLEFQIKPPLSVKFPPGVSRWPKIAIPDCDNYIKPVADATDNMTKFIRKQKFPANYVYKGDSDADAIELAGGLHKMGLVENDSRFFIEHIEKWYVRNEKDIGVKIEIYRFNVNSLIPKE